MSTLWTLNLSYTERIWVFTTSVLGSLNCSLKLGETSERVRLNLVKQGTNDEPLSFDLVGNAS